MEDTSWWRRGIIYQIYPHSFQDSNADGTGDLRGIIGRLPYLVDLGVDAVWLSPIFASPMRDFGYDIADYLAVDPLFGTMEDFDELLEAAHRCGLKLLLDLVPNHTSSDHPWFIDSRSSRTSEKRDWYIWRDPGPDGAPPNNWLSEFGGSAWEYDAGSGQYYYHAFLAAQPDLDWRNPHVREAVHEIMRFWLRKGVDGFRIDVLWHLVKDDRFRDNPVNPAYREKDPPHWQLVPVYTTDRPEVHEVVAGLRRVADEFDDRLLIGEIYLPPERLIAYYGRSLDGVHLPFNFSLLETRWHARTLAELIDDYEAALPPGSWPNWVLSNHDRPRIATRVGSEQARVAAMLLLTLRGTPTIYYGDEIGMQNAVVPPGLVRDPLGKNVPGMGRDGARSPMRWTADEYGGFSDVQPWIGSAHGDAVANVARQETDETSVLNLHRRLVAARRQNPSLAIGSYRPIVAEGDVLMFTRSHPGSRTVLVALNLDGRPASAVVRDEQMAGRVLVSSSCDRDGELVDGSIDLRPNEGLVIELHD